MSSDRRAQISISFFLLVLLVVLAVGAPQFYTVDNGLDILTETSYLAIAGLGMLIVVLTGHIDVSIGSILAICMTVAGSSAKAGVPIPLVVLLALVTGAVLGGINGLLVTRFHVHSIVVTLATMSVYRGVLLYITGGLWIIGMPPDFLAIGTGKLVGIPYPILVMLCVLLLGSWMLRSALWGRFFFAVGSNPEAARLSGIRVNAVIVSAFAISGALVGLSALLQASRLDVVQSSSGIGYEFLAITAVAVGGARVGFGGVGSVLGMALGAVLVQTSGTSLIFLHLSSYWAQALQGIFIILALTIFAVATQRASRRLRRAVIA